jgi:peroxiredoxin
MALVRLQSGDPAPDLELHDHTGLAVTLSSLWSVRPCAIFFVRHFG